MKTHRLFIFGLILKIVVIGSGSGTTVNGQQISDSTTVIFKSKLLEKLKHLSINLYVDTYFTTTIGPDQDTSNIIPFSVNCPEREAFRLNFAALEFVYDAEKIRGTVSLQYGDAPNLQAPSSSEWIQTIRQANFGVKIVKNLWFDLGYMISTVGYESLWAQLNQISFVTVGGYYEMGNVLGVKLTYQFSDKFSGGIVAGNPFTVAYNANNRLGGSVFLTYQPVSSLAFSYNNYFGNRAPKGETTKTNILYNNLIVTWDPGKHVELVGQVDFGAQTNSGMAPDTTASASMFSGFIQGLYRFNNHFSIAGRYEFFNDPDGFLSGVNTSTMRGLATNGITLSCEYKPLDMVFFRAAYRYLGAYSGSKAFYSNTSDQMQALYFTAGVKF